MNVSLTPDIEQFIQNLVDSGKYTSASEVIQAALRMFVQQQEIYQGRIEELRREIMIGIEASRRGEVVDADTVFNQLQAKLKLAREQAGACRRDLSESTTILQKAITKH